jgi:hypothetical protein
LTYAPESRSLVLLAHAEDVLMSARRVILPEDSFPPLEKLVTETAMTATEAQVLREHRAASYGLQVGSDCTTAQRRRLEQSKAIISASRQLLERTQAKLARRTP